ncbi:MAG: hypothetical protein V4682_00560 [Patescibacteria group bacterium]
MKDVRETATAVAGRVVELFPGKRVQPRLSNMSPFTHDDGTLWGMAFDGGDSSQRRGIEKIQDAFGITGQRSLGEGMDSAKLTGIGNRSIQVRPSPSRLRNSYDMDTGIHVVSYNMELPEGLNLEKGAVQGLWNKSSFLFVSQDDEKDHLRVVEKALRRLDAAIFLSDKKAFGFFIPSVAPAWFLDKLNDRDVREVQARHKRLEDEEKARLEKQNFDADWKGDSILDAESPREPAQPATGGAETKAA